MFGWSVLQDELFKFDLYCFCGLGRGSVHTGIFTKGVAYEQMFLALEGEEVSGEVFPWAIMDVSWYHWLYSLTFLVLGTYIASFA